MLDGYGPTVLHFISEPDGIDNRPRINDDLGNSADGLIFGPLSNIG